MSLCNGYMFDSLKYLCTRFLSSLRKVGSRRVWFCHSKQMLGLTPLTFHNIRRNRRLGCRFLLMTLMGHESYVCHLNRISHHPKGSGSIAWFLWVPPVVSLCLKSYLRLSVWVWVLVQLDLLPESILNPVQGLPFGATLLQIFKWHATESFCFCLVPRDNSNVFIVTAITQTLHSGLSSSGQNPPPRITVYDADHPRLLSSGGFSPAENILCKQIKTQDTQLNLNFRWTMDNDPRLQMLHGASKTIYCLSKIPIYLGILEFI